MANRITLRDVGRAAGYHHTTISLALRDSPQIPETTRRHIRDVAQRIGYRPDPMLKALAAYRQSARPLTDHGPLAWLSNTAVPTWNPKKFGFDSYVQGAQARASELGYRLEEFLLKAPGMTPDRMTRVLLARGIQGVLVAPQPWGSPRASIEMDWSSFSAVTFGYSLEWPELDLVTDHHMDSVKIAAHELWQLGYRRIGLFVSEESDARANGAFIGGFVGTMMRWPRRSQLPPMLYETWNDQRLRDWVTRHRPDALILQNSKEIDLARKALGLRVPDDIGLVSLNPSTGKGYACILQNGPEIGAKAVDLVVGMMNTNRRGIPAVPCRVLIESSWGPGNTVRAR